MRVLLAFDKFKDSLDAPAACEIAADALRQKHVNWTLDLCPLADGGEGFAEILTHAATGELRRAVAQGGVRESLLGVGWGATVHLRGEALAALGFVFRNACGAANNPPVPARWKEITEIAAHVPPDLPPVFLACDVTNPLL